MERNKYIISENTRRGLWDYAQMLIDEDHVLEAVDTLISCQKRAPKDKDNNCIIDVGALDFMAYLMKHCQKKQVRQVEYLLQEFFPNMRKDWLFFSTFITHQAYMYRRFGDDGLYLLMDKVDYYVKTGRLSQKFSPYWPKFK